MSTTSKYGFNFLLPIALTNYPIPFNNFIKDDGSYYSYNEYMSLDGNKAFYTPTNTHAIISINTTSIFDLAQKFPAYITSISPDTVIKEGIDMTSWFDTTQDNYLWILSTELNIEYNYYEFVKVSQLYVK